MKFIHIMEDLSENKEFVDDPDCQDSIYMTIDFYKKVGFEIPWIGYYASINGMLVGSAAFKGKPRNGKVEIAYGTFPHMRQQGIATEICKQLIKLALQTDPSITILARTLPEENYSTKILRKNNFILLGSVMDEEDGEVWEWEYQGAKM